MKKISYISSALLSVAMACPAHAATAVKAASGAAAIAVPAKMENARVMMQSTAGYISPGGGCQHHAVGTLNIEFNYNKADISHLGDEIASKVAKIKEIARDAGATEIKLTSENYNVRTGGPYYSNGYAQENANYFINGSLSFEVHPADIGTTIMSQLNRKSYHANFNYRMDSRYCPYGQ